MSKDKKSKNKQYNERDEDVYFIDDSKMPSVEEIENLPPTPEIDAKFAKEIEIICKKYFG